MLSPPGSQSVLNWVESVSACDIPEESPSNISHPSRNKRKSYPMSDEETPRVKVARTGLHTPTRSSSRVLDTAASSALSLSSRSSRSSTTSRNRSPPKRAQELLIQYASPLLEFVPFEEQDAFKHARKELTPLLAELLECFDEPTADPPLESQVDDAQLREIFEDFNASCDKQPNEDYWSDYVVFPILRLARRMSQHQTDISVIPVKSIDVYPTSLLPSNVDSERPTKKRVDYSVGIKVADHRTMNGLLARTKDNTIAQSNNRMLQDRALCTHVEIKTTSDVTEAMAQLKTWCCAGFRKQENLRLQSWASPGSMRAFKPAPIPLWHWDRDKVQLLIAIMDPAEDKVYFLEEATFFLARRDIRSLRKVVLMLSNVMRWGAVHYVDWFRKELLGWSHGISDHAAPSLEEAIS